MAAPANLYVRDLGSGLREVVLDCAHATTTLVDGAPVGVTALGEDEVIAMAQQRHKATCRCAQRYVRAGEA